MFTVTTRRTIGYKGGTTIPKGATLTVTEVDIFPDAYGGVTFTTPEYPNHAVPADASGWTAMGLIMRAIEVGGIKVRAYNVDTGRLAVIGKEFSA